MFNTTQKDRSLLVNEDIEILKNELKSKDEMIKSLIATQTLVLETGINSKANPTITQDEIRKIVNVLKKTQTNIKISERKH